MAGGPTAFAPRGFYWGGFQIQTGGAFECTAFQHDAFQTDCDDDETPEPTAEYASPFRWSRTVGSPRMRIGRW
jgi:hypothetical protein